ncbi:MAG: hypothetical protein GYB64_04390 [Chloroflexi bacterium]|nr:hypothetical protein [Chloroflexota bacterium]
MQRPFVVSLLVGFMLILSVTNAVVLVAGLLRLPLMAAVMPPGSIALRLGLAAGWAITWAALAAGLWGLKPWSYTGSLVAFPLGAASIVLSRSVLTVGPYEQGRWPFILSLSMLAALLVVGILTRPAVRHAFNKRNVEGDPLP